MMRNNDRYRLVAMDKGNDQWSLLDTTTQQYWSREGWQRPDSGWASVLTRSEAAQIADDLNRNLHGNVSSHIGPQAQAIFAKYAGQRPLDETSIDDIPHDEQQAFWASLGEIGEVSEDDANRLYEAWHAAQVAFVKQSGPASQLEVPGNVTFPPIGARVANIDVVNRDPSKNSGTVRSLNLAASRPFAEVVMDDGRVEKCFGLAERGCGWYRPLSDQSPSIEVSLHGMDEGDGSPSPGM